MLILGSLAALGPLSIDMYLPAFPELARDLGTSASRVQLTLTGFLVGIAIGQVVIGSISDQLGRRRPLVAGLALYAGASALCAIAPSAEILACCRFLQGLAGAAGIVMSRTIVRDLYSGIPAIRFFSRLMLVNGSAPILAPSLGGVLLRLTSWRGLFAALSLIGLVLLVAVAIGLRETHPPEARQPGGLRTTVAGFSELLHHRVFVGYALGLGLAMGTMFGFIGGGSFALQEVYGLSPQQFALTFGCMAVFIVGCGQLSGRLAGRVPPRRLLLNGLVGMSAGAGGILVVAVAHGPIEALLAALFVTGAGFGLVMPNATALALTDHPHLAGSASALLGVVAFPIGAAIAPLIGIAGRETAVPMGAVMAVMALGALTSVLTLTRRRGRRSGA